MSVRGQRATNVRRRWLLIGVASLAASLLPVSAVGAIQESAGADESVGEAHAATDEPASGVDIVRYAGSEQYELSLAVAQALVDADGGTSEWVVLASGESWADAAAAGPLAASLGAPVVLVPPGGLQAATARPDLVEFLRSSGVRRVVIVGDPNVLPNHEPSVLYGLGMLPRNIERVHSEDAIGTSVAVAERIGMPAEFADLGRTVLIASDQGVADAVAVGPLAAAGPFPLLLSAPDVLDPRIATYLTDQQIEHVVLVGGTAAITPTVDGAIKAAGATVSRLAGRDRSDTAHLAAELFEQHTADDRACTGDSARIGLVPAQHPEQALAAGPLLARNCTPLRYTASGRLPPELRNTLYLAQQQLSAIELLVFGDESAIADTALDVSLPPTQLAFVSVGGITENGVRSTQIAVVNEHGAIRLFPQTEVEIPAWPHLNSDRVCRLRELDWSPGGRFLSYRRLCTAEIFVLDTETGESYQVASEGVELVFEEISYEGGPWYVGRMGPSWSPDGSSFVFTAFLDDPSTVGTWQGNPLHFAELFVHDVESRTTRRLTENTVHDLVGSWSPDGSVVTRMQHAEPAASDPYYRAWRSYAFTKVSEVTPAAQPVRCGIGRRATWSPDGSRLAYYRFDGWWTVQVAVCTSDSTNRRQLTPVNCIDCTEGHQHRGARILGWNRSGSSFAFSDTDFVPPDDGGFPESETTVNYVLDLESGDVRKLFESTHDTYGPFPLVYLDWSDEGDGLLYLRLNEDQSAPRDLVLVDEVTGEFTTLRDIPPLWPDYYRPIHRSLRFSPDQSQLLLIYDGTSNGLDGGMWLSSVRPGDLVPLVDFGAVISMAADDAATNSDAFPLQWQCATEWTAIGVLSTCGYST